MERELLTVTPLNSTAGRTHVHVSSSSDSAIIHDVLASEEGDQSWFWTAEWQSRHREALRDLEEGRYEDHTSMDGFIASLRARAGDG